MNETENQIQSSISLLIANLKKTIEAKGHVKCPSCAEEWTKLRPCMFLGDSEDGMKKPGARAWEHVCVVCAETLVSFEWVDAQYPLPGVLVETRWSGPKSIQVQIGTRIEDDEIPKNAFATVTGYGHKFVATSDGTGRPLRFKEERDKSESYADNVFSLWSQIKYRLRNPLKQEEKDSRMEEVERMIRNKKR